MNPPVLAVAALRIIPHRLVNIVERRGACQACQLESRRKTGGVWSGIVPAK